MSERKRVLILIFLMAISCLVVAGVTITVLYHTSFKEQQAQLVETAQSQARLIEAVARFDKKYIKDYPEGSEKATLSQIIDAHEQYAGFGKSGEFTLSKKKGDDIVFLLSHRHFDLDQPRPVPFQSELAEPMRRALLGHSGTVVGLDYRGEVVMAAHEPVAELDLGIVAKIDLSEIRAPFVKAGIMAGIFSVLVVLGGTALFFKISNPMIRLLEEQNSSLELANKKLKHEIVEREQVEEQFKVSLKEKEILLQEIHHRVNNNMQVIISLIKLQFETIDNEQYIELFKDTLDRIKSMALVHKKLYQSKDFAKIDCNEYVKSLVKELFKSHAVDSNKISLKLEKNDVLLSLDNAVSCGLIINELVTNSLKYAFPGDIKGDISIGHSLIDKDQVEIRVADNGVGLPAGLDFRNNDTLGLQVVISLAEHQLRGKVSVSTSKGTEFRIRFKVPSH